MEMHHPAVLRALNVRLLPNGEVLAEEGGRLPLPATWVVRRRWLHGGVEHCFVVATLNNRPYFGDVLAAALTDPDVRGVPTRVERHSRQ